MSKALTKLTLRVDQVQPMDCVDVFRGRHIRTVRVGTYDFGTWPDHHRAWGVELEVGRCRMVVQSVTIGGDVVPYASPVWEEMEVTRYRADTWVEVLRGVEPKSDEPTEEEVAAAVAAQRALETSLGVRP